MNSGHQSGGPPLPPGWTSAIDPASGRTYYANPHTGASSWEPPVVVPPPPPVLRVVPPPPPPPRPSIPPVQQQQQQQQPRPQAPTTHIPPTGTTTSYTHESELTALTVGQVADLCATRHEAALAVQGEQEDAAAATTLLEPYVPLNPAMIVLGRPLMESGRLDIRVHTLHDKLRKIPM